MADRTSPRSGISRKRALGPLLVGVLAAASLFAFAWRSEQAKRYDAARAALAEETLLVQSLLEARLNDTVAPLEGMAMLIGVGSAPPARALAEVGPQIEAREPCFISLALAPDLVIRDVYPREANAAALGLDFRLPPGDQSAIEAMRQQRIVMTDPFRLRQGREAVAVRLPYGRLDRPTPQGHGLISIALDLPCLMADTGVERFASRHRAVLVSLDDAGRPRSVVHGRDFPVGPDVHEIDLDVPGTRWRLRVDGLARPGVGQYFTEQP